MYQENSPDVQERRKDRRIECRDTLVLNPEGACEILEISSGGFSFKCLFEQSLSEEWMVDIIDNKGRFINKVHVEKVWQAEQDKQQSTSACVLAAGVKFKNLTPEQRLMLDKFVLSNEPD